VPFDDDVVDAALVEELPKQEAGRAGANYGDLGSHGLTSPSQLCKVPRSFSA
jgi:hypothetical protein